GPKSLIDSLSSAGSFLDGGGSRPAQRAAIPLLEAEHINRESAALKKTFAPKRALVSQRLKAMGIQLDREPEGTFYAWANLSALPPALNNGMDFFRAALKEKVICVPGEFFDINPGQRRADRPSRFRAHVRISFGPEIESVSAGLDRLEAMVATHS
ncbi:MAG: pyridoxal phosphate-dependent aminotransferase, partial [Myxococcota bacterium]|nr:pyridoxal phosphate-dependent aminotransferase [Myxococcota bacterium]